MVVVLEGMVVVWGGWLLVRSGYDGDYYKTFSESWRKM